MKRRILLVDDEPAILLTLKALLDIHGFEVETASSARDAKAKLRISTFHMVITDMRMEHNEAGLEVSRAAKKTSYNPAVAVLTAFPVNDDIWRDEGADEMLVKPLNSQALIRQLEALLVSHEDKKHRAEPEIPAIAAAAGNGARKGQARASARGNAAARSR